MNENEITTENQIINNPQGNDHPVLEPEDKAEKKPSRQRKKKTETEVSPPTTEIATVDMQDINEAETGSAISEFVTADTDNFTEPAVTTPKPKAFRPGYLRSDTAILLQTINAQRYFFSRGEGTVSLNYFNRMMVTIWQAAAADDPYADLFLLKVYDALISTRRELQQLNQKYAALIHQDGVELPIISTNAPLRLTLHYFIPYSFMATYLLADYDQLARCILSLKRFGFLPNDEANSVLRETGDKFCRALTIPLHWQATGVTREDMHKDNELAEKAIELMGQLNPQVLAGTLRAPYAPIIKKAVQENSSDEAI